LLRAANVAEVGEIVAGQKSHRSGGPHQRPSQEPWLVRIAAVRDVNQVRRPAGGNRKIFMMPAQARMVPSDLKIFYAMNCSALEKAGKNFAFLIYKIACWNLHNALFSKHENVVSRYKYARSK
jgi:hypothetical protein